MSGSASETGRATCVPEGRNGTWEACARDAHPDRLAMPPSSSPDPTTARHIHVSGRVQGVAFRWSMQQRAEQLGIVGWVRNLSDGRVEGRIQGPSDAIDEMLLWLADGPPPARVDDLDVRACEPKEDLSGFSVRSIG